MKQVYYVAFTFYTFILLIGKLILYMSLIIQRNSGNDFIFNFKI